MSESNQKRRRRRLRELDERLRNDPEIGESYGRMTDEEQMHAASQRTWAEAEIDSLEKWIGSASEAWAGQLVLLNERLVDLLGSDLGVSGSQVGTWFVEDADGEIAVMLIVGGRGFTFHPEDVTNLAVWRKHDDHLDYAEVDGACERTGPWVCTSSLPPEAS